MTVRTSLLAALGLVAAVPAVMALKPSPTPSAWRVCPAPRIVDGDTIRCGSVRVRLLGIDAPELHECPRYRRCAPGDGSTSRRSLLAGATNGPVRFLPVTTDHYGRTVAIVTAGSVNLSCWQLERGQAIYKPQWDNGGRIATTCGRLGL
jgi:endonuclease YncB( thermonuclease family)